MEADGDTIGFFGLPGLLNNELTNITLVRTTVGFFNSNLTKPTSPHNIRKAILHQTKLIITINQRLK